MFLDEEHEDVAEEIQSQSDSEETIFQENNENNDEICEKNEEFNEINSQSEVITENSKVQNSEDYLEMARRIQADFDNYRRHSTENIKKARIDGQSSVIEVFLPCLDTFKEAKKQIADENVLKGVEMIEKKIGDALASLGVVKLDSVGQVYDPHIHDSIAVMRDESKDDGIILEEFQAGYKFNDKVLRYAKVIVNKL